MHPVFNPDTKKKLRNSVDFLHYRNQLLLGCGLYLILLLIYSARFSLVSGGIGILLLILTVCFGPLLGYYTYRMILLFRSSDSYEFCRATLSSPHQNLWLRTMYFTVVVELPNGQRFPADTNPVFLTHGIVGPLLEDYVNQTVTIGYNVETGHIVVIG